MYANYVLYVAIKKIPIENRTRCGTFFFLQKKNALEKSAKFHSAAIWIVWYMPCKCPYVHFVFDFVCACSFVCWRPHMPLFHAIDRHLLLQFVYSVFIFTICNLSTICTIIILMLITCFHSTKNSVSVFFLCCVCCLNQFRKLDRINP